MNANVRNEEITALGDFVLTSFTRDFEVIKGKFSKMDEAFRDGFIAKLNFVKVLESTVLLSENQKAITESLYAEAGRLSEDLNFLSAYFAEASLNTGLVTELKHDLYNRNIEGALLKLESLKQFAGAHIAELTAEGMDPDFVAVLKDYKVSMMEKNRLQNELMNTRKQLTETNVSHYEELLKMIRKIIRNGKLVFKGQVKQDEYTTVKVIQRMRTTPPKKENDMKE